MACSGTGSCLGGSGADSNGVPLSLSAEVMLEGFERLFRGCYVCRYCGCHVGIDMIVHIP
jgi:hypothetical protein